MKRFILCLLIVGFLCGCVSHSLVTIEQRVKVDSFQDNTFLVETLVWINEDINFFDRGVADIQWDFNIKSINVCKVKATQFEKAQKIKNQILEISKSFKGMCE